MADNAVLFKLLVKAIGFKYNVIPTFMAKPHQDQPGQSPPPPFLPLPDSIVLDLTSTTDALSPSPSPPGPFTGCSGHVHISLRDPKTQTNVFSVTEEEFASGGRKDAKYDDLKFVSRECEHFLAGVLEGLEDVMPLLVPTINGWVLSLSRLLRALVFRCDESLGLNFSLSRLCFFGCAGVRVSGTNGWSRTSGHR